MERILFLFVIFFIAITSIIHFNPLFHNILIFLVFFILIIVRRFSFSNLNINSIFFLLNLLLLLPVVLSLVTSQPLVAITTLKREVLNSNIFISETLFLIAIQITIFYLFSTTKKHFFVDNIIDYKKSENIKSHFICMFLSMVFVILSSILSNKTGNIFNSNYGSVEFYHGISSFGGWPIIFCLSVSVFIVETRLIKYWHNVFIFLVIFYWLFHGNRSEILILAVSPVYLYLSREKKYRPKFAKLKLFYTIIIVFIIIIVFHFVGLYRNAESIQEVFISQEQTSRDRSLSISTIGPSAYTISSTVGLYRLGELDFAYGTNYYSYLLRTFPSKLNFFGDVVDFSETLIDSADTIGGAHSITEAYVAFGAIGVYLYTVILATLLSLISKMAICDNLSRVFLVGLILYSPRIVWYGNIYLYKFTLLIVFTYVAALFYRIIKEKLVGCQNLKLLKCK